jgi:hypothetical protein
VGLAANQVILLEVRIFLVIGYLFLVFSSMTETAFINYFPS